MPNLNPPATYARATVVYTTAALAPTAAETGTVTMAAGYRLYSVQTSRPARVRVYETLAARTADLARPPGLDPAASAGVVLDYATTGTAAYPLSPLVDGASLEAAPSASIPITITNNDISSGAVTVTLTYLRTE